jgi:hypothetical protein
MSRAAKRGARDCRVLNEVGVLQQVLEYAGAGEYTFLATVSKQWQQLYEALHNNNNTDTSGISSLCSTATLISAAFASVSRVRFAHECGLNLAVLKRRAQRLVGRCADAATLATAVELGLELTPTVARSAALCGAITRLQVFLTHRCKLPRNIIQYAARSGSIELLVWLKHSGHPFTIPVMSSAASQGHVHVLDFLRSAGCMWESSVTSAAARGGQLAALQ